VIVIAWDDNKSKGDIIKSDDWDAMVSDQKGRTKLFSTDEGTGSDCTDGDGDSGRVFTLSNTKLTAKVQVFVEGRLEAPSNITVTHNSSGTTVEFKNNLWDTDNIIIFSYAYE